MAELRLRAREFRDLTRWRWVLTDTYGTVLCDHEVRLDPGCWEYEAFADLAGYLRWHVAPDRRAQDEARIVGDVGAWIGSAVLGPVAGMLARSRPVTVRVTVPEAAAELLFRPLELAHVNGEPLATQDVTLVMATETGNGPVAAGARDQLRVLGLFSLPEGGRSLNLHRERCSLVNLIRGIAAAGRAAEVRVLQYGVTRDRLRDVLVDAEGWDIIHVAGHGTPGELLLETAAGEQDRVGAADLADLLYPARDRVKLVTISACWSAAVTAGEQRHLLGLPSSGQRGPDEDQERPRYAESGGSASGAIATELASRLGCAVLAMRYPVGDEFAVALTEKLYDLLARLGQPLPRAVGMTLRQLLTGTRYPALSAATPALFGERAVDLRLAAPDRERPENQDPAALKMAGFSPQPERFVGRTGVMARASAALAAQSGIPGVLLHGMPGGGKTACALELAYGHEHAFEHLVLYKAPDDGMAIDGALTDFAFVLELELPGFQMLDALVTEAELTGFLPELTNVVRQRRMLIVIDNAESLLTEKGRWRDPRWGRVIGALTEHEGPGRVILTSRRIPAGPTGLRVEAVDALSADEALLLVRELQHLNALSHGEIPGLKQHTARRLARQVLELAQGHPKLLELADSQAAHPARLAALVEAGNDAWRTQGNLPDGFFSSEETGASSDDYWPVLAAWTKAVAHNLAPGERDLFWFLCCLEEGDRERIVLEDNWNDLWNRLAREGEAPDLNQVLPAVSNQGLVAIRRGAGPDDESYAIHPSVAEAGRGHAGQSFQAAVDAEMTVFWSTVLRHASGRASDGVSDTTLHVRAGLAVVPYLARQRRWDDAAALLEDAFVRDQSRANAAAVLPAIQQITRHEPRWAVTQARVLAVLAPSAAEASLRAAMADADARSDYRMAAVAAGELGKLYRDGGQLTQALDLIRQKADYHRKAGLGPWTQLSAEVDRLEVLTFMERAREVLDQINSLRDRMDTLPSTPGGDDDPTLPWGVRESLLRTGYHAALLLGQYAESLAFNADKAASMRERRAPATEIARTQFGNYGPLLFLGRTDEALHELLDCRQVFEDAHDALMLGITLGALGHIESTRGHGDAAIRLQRDGIRYLYLAGDVNSIAVSYHNLGTYLRDHARQPGAALASHLTSALIRTLTGVGGSAADSTRQAAADLLEIGASAIPPADVTDLCRQIGDLPGTDLPRLIATLPPSIESAEVVLRDLVAQAQEIAAQPSIPPPDDGERVGSRREMGDASADRTG